MRHQNQPAHNTDEYKHGHSALLAQLVADVARQSAPVPPSSERVLEFVENILRCPRSDHLKVLAIRAALKTIVDHAGAVDCVIVSSGQIDSREQVTWDGVDRGRTLYCYAPGPVSSATIDEMLPPAASRSDLAHIIFVTTDAIDPAVREHASGVYHRTNGIEFAILDCLGFVRHFLHLFHRHRAAFLDAYQALVLSEPDSAVSFAVKRAFLVLRETAEAEPES